MINGFRHIAIKTPGKIHWLILPVLLILFSCGGSKEVTTSEFSERKLFKETFHEANLEKMIGHYEKAIELFEKCLSMEPNNAAISFALSDLYEIQGDDVKTLSFAENAYRLDDSNKWYAIRLADLYFEREDFSKTADLYARIIDSEKNIDLKFKYTDALIRSERYEEALKMLNEIEVETGKIPEVSFTKHDLHIQLGKPELAEKELQDLMDENPGNSDYKVMVAEFYLQARRFDRSKEIIESLIVNDPEYGQAYIMLADIHLRQDNLSETFKNLKTGFSKPDISLDQKLEILLGLIPYSAPGERDYKEIRTGIGELFEQIYNPESNNFRLFDYYGYFLTLHGDKKKAEEQYQKSCELNASSFNSWVQLMSLSFDLKNYEKMLENGKTAVELFPAQPIIYLLTGIAAKETEDYQNAEEWFFLGKDLIVKDDELRSEFLYELGDMNYRRDNPDEGKFYFEQAIQAFPGNVKVYADNSERLMKTGELDEAETEIKKGLAIASKNALLLDIYGQILFLKKEYAGAADAFVQALYGNFTNAAIMEHYADALFFTGEKEKAIELWGEAIKLGDASDMLIKKFEDKTYYEPE